MNSCDLIIRHYQIKLYMPQPRPSDLTPVYRASPISPEGRRLVQHLRTKTASSKADPPTSPPQRVAEGDHPASASRGIVARSGAARGRLRLRLRLLAVPRGERRALLPCGLRRRKMMKLSIYP